MSRKVRTAILISGTGSNMEALVRSTLGADHPAEICLVLSNRPDAGGLERAEHLGVQAMAIDHTNFKSRASFDAALHAVLTQAQIDLICCAGFMRILSPEFVRQWEGRIINIHPSLLPKYKGLNTHRRALNAGDTKHGASVHWVSEELDAGTVIAQSRVEITPEDTEESLRLKVLQTEHGLYSSALYTIANAMMH